MLLAYLVSVWLLVDFPLGFWLFVIGAGTHCALQCWNGANSRLSTTRGCGGQRNIVGDSFQTFRDALIRHGETETRR